MEIYFEEDYINQLENLFGTTTQFNLNDVINLRDQIKYCEEKSEDNFGSVKILYETAFKNPQIKFVEAIVPLGILPSELSATLYDVRVACRGPDDTIYKNNKWIRENITRGMTFLKIYQKNKDNTFDLVIYANKKFIGGVGDEDDLQPDNNDAWQEFCIQNPKTTSQIISLTKINGEAGHFAGRFINEEFYIITGSKNVHMVIKSEADIDKYTEPRYSIAKIVARSVMKTLNSLPEEKLNLLKIFLHKTKITTVTELTQPDYQHIVNLSHLKEPVINFLFFTPTYSKHEYDSFTAISPHYGQILASLLGLNAIGFETFHYEEVDEKINLFRCGKGEEGKVLYFLSDTGKTIGLSKVKTVWYIMLRALREKTAGQFAERRIKESTLSDKIKKTKKRFREIQNWLKFTDQYRKSWEDLAEAFMPWVENEIRKGTFEPNQIRAKFPIIWGIFLESTGKNDDIPFT